MDAPAGHRLLVFRVADLVCAAEVLAVREILAPRPATRIPGAPDAVAGLINVRGELVTLVDGSRLLGVQAHGNGGSTLLLELGDRQVAMTVDEVLDLISPEAGGLVHGSALPGIDRRLVQGVGERAGRPFVLLNLEALFGPILSLKEGS